MPSTLPSARLSHALLACGFAASTAGGQALATGDLRTSTTTPVEARSTLALGLPLNRGSDLLLKAGLDGAGWLGAGGPGTSKGYAAANLIIGLEGGRGERCAWLRVGTGGLWDGLGAHSLLLAGLGGSMTRGPVAIELSVTETRLSPVARTVTLAPASVPIDTPGVPPPAPTTARQFVGGGVWEDVRAQLKWSGGPIEARLTGGVEIPQGGGRATRWLRTEATGWLTPQLGVVVGVGSPSLPVLEAPRLSGPFTLGFRLAFGRAARPVVARPPPKRENPSFEIRSVSGDLRLLRVRVPDASRVELTADFVDWRVVSLVPAGGGVWEAQLAIGPGSHRVSIRRDGGPWAVPPGLPAVADDFTGAAGLLRVE